VNAKAPAAATFKGSAVQAPTGRMHHCSAKVHCRNPRVSPLQQAEKWHHDVTTLTVAGCWCSNVYGISRLQMAACTLAHSYCHVLKE
jgi:hypothetical protein